MVRSWGLGLVSRRAFLAPVENQGLPGTGVGPAPKDGPFWPHFHSPCHRLIHLHVQPSHFLSLPVPSLPPSLSPREPTATRAPSAPHRQGWRWGEEGRSNYFCLESES